MARGIAEAGWLATRGGTVNHYPIFCTDMRFPEAQERSKPLAL